MDSLAEVDKLVVVVEGGKVHPKTAERAFVVLGISTDIDGGFTVAGAFVFSDCVFEFGNCEVQFVESVNDSRSDVEFSKL